MEHDMNKITLVGEVGRDPDLQQMADGRMVAHFSVATIHPVSQEEADEGEAYRTDWHRLTLYGKQAEFADEHLRVGSRVYVEGRLQYDSYERSGVVIPSAEIVVREIVIIRDAPGARRTKKRRLI